MNTKIFEAGTWQTHALLVILEKRMFGTNFSFDLYAVHGYGAYICGEETALIESIEGKKGQPRFKPPFPASYGVFGKPTNVNNTESFTASIPWILQYGGQAFADLGVANCGRYKVIFSVWPCRKAW